MITPSFGSECEYHLLTTFMSGQIQYVWAGSSQDELLPGPHRLRKRPLSLLRARSHADLMERESGNNGWTVAALLYRPLRVDITGSFVELPYILQAGQLSCSYLGVKE